MAPTLPLNDTQLVIPVAIIECVVWSVLSGNFNSILTTVFDSSNLNCDVNVSLSGLDCQRIANKGI